MWLPFLLWKRPDHIINAHASLPPLSAVLRLEYLYIYIYIYIYIYRRTHTDTHTYTHTHTHSYKDINISTYARLPLFQVVSSQHTSPTSTMSDHVAGEQSSRHPRPAEMLCNGHMRRMSAINATIRVHPGRCLVADPVFAVVQHWRCSPILSAANKRRRRRRKTE